MINGSRALSELFQAHNSSWLCSKAMRISTIFSQNRFVCSIKSLIALSSFLLLFQCFLPFTTFFITFPEKRTWSIREKPSNKGKYPQTQRFCCWPIVRQLESFACFALTLYVGRKTPADRATCCKSAFRFLYADNSFTRAIADSVYKPGECLIIQTAADWAGGNRHCESSQQACNMYF